MDLREPGSAKLERLFLWGIPVALLCGSVATRLLLSHLHLHNPRMQYGISHLPEELLLAAFFAAIAGLLLTVLSRSASAEAKPASYFLGALVIAFCLCWLPVLLAGGFVQDDWMLLSAAAIRKILYIHPSYAWFTLDTVDGNFRPLGTGLYFVWMLRFFGASAFAFLCGNFVVNLLGSLVAFFVVRELGYSKMAGAAASLLYTTRGLNYIENAWACALGDGIVILLGGLAVLGVLRANRRQGLSAFAYYAFAWILLCIATFAKQSSFAIPLIVALAVLLRPGEDALVPFRRRAGQAFLALIAYSIPVAVIFFHAKALLQQGTPYPVSLTLSGLTQWLFYVPWFFVGMGFPGKYKVLNVLTGCAGAAILAGLAVLVARVPRLLGNRPRDIAFLLLAGLAAIAPYALLPTRIAPYYGSMSAFWISLAFGIALTRFGGAADRNSAARNAWLALYLIVIVGSVDIRLKQTGLVPSGGYIWGTYGMDQEKNSYDQLAGILAKYPNRDTLVLVDSSEDARYYTSMALLADPGLQHMLVFDPETRTYRSNDLAGLRPKDEPGALNDAQAYHWNVPMDSSVASRFADQNRALWVAFDGGKIHPVPPVRNNAE